MRKDTLIGLAATALFIVGCASDDAHVVHRDHHPSPGAVKSGPPAHAPAHGYRRKFQYRYYADQCVYHAVDRGLYFWLEGDDWRVGVELPSHIALETSAGVIVELDADSPYDHYLAQKYGGHPGKGKAKAKGKAKGKNKSKATAGVHDP